MLKNALKLAVAGTLVMATVSAVAATKTTALSVTAKVASNCSVAAPNLAFTDYDASADVDGATDLKVNCSKGTPYSIKLGAGNGTIAQRLLKSGLNQLEYNLYTDGARSSIWGETVGTDTDGGTGNGMSASKAVTHTVYGRIVNSVANQDAPAGSYADAVLVTVEY